MPKKKEKDATLTDLLLNPKKYKFGLKDLH